MAALVTLAQAKVHLGITTTDHDADVQSKLEQASAEIGLLCTDAAVVATWTVASVPPAVQGQVLQLLAWLRGNRGDVPMEDPRPAIAKTLIALGYRDPVVA